MRPIALVFLLAAALAAQDERDPLRDALHQRDLEIQRLQRELAEKDIELARLRRTLDDIRMLLDISGASGAAVKPPPATVDRPRDPVSSATVKAPADTATQSEVPPKPSATEPELAQWIEDLGAKGKLTRDQAIESLSAVGEQALDRLASVFPAGSLQTRRSAAYLIGKIGSPNGVPLLQKALDDADVKVRLYTVSALGAIETPGSSLLLIDSLEDADPGVRMTAAALLTERYGKDYDDDAAAWRAWAEETGIR